MHRTTLILVMTLVSGSAMADKVRLGDWVLETEENYAEAFTANASGSQFGFLCLDDSCQFYLDTKTKCDDKTQIPMLINSDSGAVYVNTTCMHFRSADGIRYISAIEGSDAVTAIST